jgi:hypothetical protein
VLGKASDPVFIVGQPRSGSSILYRLVQTHPTFAPEQGSNLSESDIMANLASSPSLDVLSVRSFVALDDAGWAAFEGGLGAVERRRRLATKVPRAVLLDQPRVWSALGCESVLRSYLDAAAVARGAPRLVEKTPHHLAWVPHLVRTFPDAQLLCITRHPVHAFASFRRRATVEGEASWATLTPEMFVGQWRAEVGLIWRWLREERERFRLVRYEHLVEDPDEEQRRLFRWLGVAPLAELPGREEADPHAPASDAAALYGEIRPSSTDWRALIAEHEAQTIERSLEPEMEGLGYRPVSGS